MGGLKRSRNGPGPGAYRVGDFLIEPLRNRVSSPNGASVLEPKVMDVLTALAEHAGDVVARADLIERLWGVEFGGDESLTRAVSHLRKVFGDARDEARIIETIPKRGYRLIAPVRPAAQGGAASRSRFGMRWPIAADLLIAALAIALALWPNEAEAPPHAERTGIVLTVRPFAVSPNEPGAEGLAQELSAEIARSPLIRTRTLEDVRPGADVMPYVLQGDIQRLGARVRVSAQLVDAESGEVIWGESYERPYDPQFSARAAVVGSIVSEFQLPLFRSVKRRLERRPIFSLPPWALTLMVTWTPGAEGALPAGPPSEDSYWLQKRALALDPDYAPAHALFAELAAYHALFHPPFDTTEHRERARRHAERALELAPYDSEVIYQIALYHRLRGDRAQAEGALERVLELQPHHPLARVELAYVRGQCSPNAEAAIAELVALQRGMSEANPARWVALAHLSEIYLARGEFARAREAAVRSRQIVRQTWTAMTLAAADAELGPSAEGAAALAEQRREWPSLDLAYFAERVVPRLCLGGDYARMQAAFRRLAQAGPPA